VEFDRILEQIKPLLIDQALSVMEIIMQVRGFPEKKIVDTINFLVDHQKIVLQRDGRYRWRGGRDAEDLSLLD
jgi:hypothetical protein